MLRLENPQMLWGLLPLALFLIYKFVSNNRSSSALKVSSTGYLLGALALFFCVLGLSRPQLGSVERSNQKVTSNLYLAMDISQSMLAGDAPPTRLAFAIAVCQKLLDSLPDSKVALMPFANDGYLLMPLTSDHDAVKLLLSTMSPSLTTDQGTDLTQSLASLWEVISRNERARKTQAPAHTPMHTPMQTTVVLLSDGESHPPFDPGVAKRFGNHGIPIYTVGIGTTAGTRLAIGKRAQFDSQDYPVFGEQVVLTRKHIEPLRTISQLTGARFYNGEWAVVASLSQEISRYSSEGRVGATFRVKREIYPFLFAVGLFLLMAEFCFGRWQYAVRTVLAPITVLALLSNRVPANPALQIQYEKETDPKLRSLLAYNLGVAYEKQGQYERASELFLEGSFAEDAELRKRALFNLGNTQLKQGDPVTALESYQESYDTTVKNKAFNEETNRKLSENMVLAKKILEQSRLHQSSSMPSGKPNRPTDLKGPQKFKREMFSEARKKRLFDAIQSEEIQILQRLQGKSPAKNGKASSNKPW